MDLHNAYCTYGTCSQHRNRIIQQCIAGTAATLHYPLCTECGYDASRSIRLIYANRTRNAISGESKQEAVNMAATSTKGRIQVQATLSAVKEMAGWTLYACLLHDICCGTALS